MIFNLSKYVSDGTGIVPWTNGIDPTLDNQGLQLIQTGGQDKSRGLKVDRTVQFISAEVSRVKAYQTITTVYEFLKNRFIVALPEVTVDSIVYPAVRVAQFIPIQEPGYIGTDENGLHQWSVNIQVTTGGN